MFHLWIAFYNYAHFKTGHCCTNIPRAVRCIVYVKSTGQLVKSKYSCIILTLKPHKYPDPIFKKNRIFSFICETKSTIYLKLISICHAREEVYQFSNSIFAKKISITIYQRSSFKRPSQGIALQFRLRGNCVIIASFKWIRNILKF